jgi:hypothetical protein
MTKQETTRRRPNFFDLLFIVLILAVALVAYVLSHGQLGGTTDTTTRTYLVELPDLQPGMADCVSVGDTVTDNVKNYDVGTVTEVQVIPATATAFDEENGIYRQVALDDQINLMVTIQAETTETDTAVETVSGYTLRTGTSVSLTIGQLTAAGYILTVER